MAVFRIEKNDNYTVMSNYHLRDKNLSLKAKGLLSFMLSLPDNWDYSLSGLVSSLKEEETSIKSALNELKTVGYLAITRERNDKGTFVYIYDVYETPKSDKLEEKNPPLENPPVDNPSVEEPSTEQPSVENRVQINTNILNTDNKSSSSCYERINACVREVEHKLGRTLSGTEYDKTGEWLKVYSEELILHAVSIATLNNKKSFQYINGILRNWKNAGYKTVEEVRSAEQPRRQKEEDKEHQELFDYDWLNESGDG